ncbi:MAG: hypothetical protein ACJ76K_08495 [Solirubrobacteraceae bacterium]
MRRIIVVLLGALAVLVVASQLFVPGIAERRAEHRLERHGGDAKVSMSALPAARLLFHHGDSLTVRGSGLRLDTEEREEDLDRMDGFDKVSVELDRVRAGPMHASSFSLRRGDGERDYRTRMTGSTSAAEVGSFLGGAFGGLAGGLLGGSAQVPVRVRATIRSRAGTVQVISATGTVAGIPADPLVRFVVAAVASGL